MISQNSAVWAELIWAFIRLCGAGSSKTVFSSTGLVLPLGWLEELSAVRHSSLHLSSPVG